MRLPGDECGRRPRPDWRDSVALAADLALLGILVALASLPVLTAGAALATASAASTTYVCTRTLPPFATLGRTFLRALLPGLGATLVAGAAAVPGRPRPAGRGVGAGPGGVPLTVVTSLIAAAAVAIALLALVRVGATGGRGWLRALRWAAGRLAARPWVGVVVLLVVALPAVLAAAIPVTALFLAGFALFALPRRGPRHRAPLRPSAVTMGLGPRFDHQSWPDGP
jgi:hypothetical protein